MNTATHGCLTSTNLAVGASTVEIVSKSEFVEDSKDLASGGSVVEGLDIVFLCLSIDGLCVVAENDWKMLDRLIELVTTRGDQFHVDGCGKCSITSHASLLGVELAGPVLLDLWSVSATTAECVWVLCSTALSSSSHDTRDTTALAPPFDRVLHTCHRSALSDVTAGTVGLSAVGSAGCDGISDEVDTNGLAERFWEGDLGSIFDGDVENALEATCIHLILCDVVADVLDGYLHLQAPCLLRVLT